MPTRLPAQGVARLDPARDGSDIGRAAANWVNNISWSASDLSPGGVRPTHFDRCDDRSAHYVSGNSLSPGDYPVGVAFSHPRQENAFFDLVNLPTPRRRMAYPYYFGPTSRNVWPRSAADRSTVSWRTAAALGARSW